MALHRVQVLAGLTLLVVLFPAGPATAQSPADIAKAFQAADKNHDGKLDLAEFATLPQTIRDRAVDANGDGFYTLAELTPQTSSANAVEVRQIVSIGCYLAIPMSRFWLAAPGDLSPDEVVLQVDVASAKPAGNDGSETVYGVTRVVAGAFSGKAVTVAPFRPVCDGYKDAAGADILVGKLNTAADGTEVLSSRPMRD